MRRFAALCVCALVLHGTPAGQTTRTNTTQPSEPTGVTPVRNVERAWLGADALLPLAIRKTPTRRKPRFAPSAVSKIRGSFLN